MICEKPLASNQAEVDAAIACARENQVVLFEAFKTAYLPNFHLLRQALPKVGKLRKVFFNYCQYSSRYQRYLDGENPNTFNPAFSNGSIMDIGFTAWRRRWHYSVNRKACRQPPVCWQAVWMPTAWW